jgi:hypothetical protein
MGWEISFQNCDALINYLEEKFAPNYEIHNNTEKRIYMNNYILNIHLNAQAADILIQNLFSTKKNLLWINELLTEINFSEALITL